MKARVLNLTQTQLKTRLSYDPGTGVFTRVSGRYVGRTAGNKTSSGYLRLKIGDMEVLAHRIASLYMEGYIPSMVDHIDGDPGNNQWTNLRVCNVSQNGANRRKQKRTSSCKYKGVSYRGNKTTPKYEVTIMCEGSPIYLGYFEDPINAAITYDIHATRLFGNYAHTNFS